MVAVASVAYGVWYIILRYVNETHDFNKTVLWSNICLFVVGLIAYCISKKYRRSFMRMMKLNGKKAVGLNLCNELICSLGDTLIIFAGTLAPIALASFVSQGVQPFAVMILGVLLTKLFPKIEQEKINKREVIRRLLTMVLCVVGLALIQFG